MSFYPQLDNLSLDELIERFDDQPPFEDESSVLWYQEIAWKFREHGARGVEFLWSRKDVADASRRMAVLFGLAASAPDDPRVRDLLIEHLRDRRALVVAEAIDGLSHVIGTAEVVDEVLALKDHRSPYVRGAVLRFMRRVRGESSRDLLLSALNDTHWVVRENAVDELDELGDPGDIPHLRPLLDDPHADVRQAACTAIENLEWLAEEEQAVGAS